MTGSLLDCQGLDELIEEYGHSMVQLVIGGFQVRPGGRHTATAVNQDRTISREKVVKHGQP